MSNIEIALVMTLVGMGIVFIGILVLWGLMALMVRIWPHDAGEEDAAEDESGTAAEDDSLKAKAAAAAVAVALSFRQSGFAPSAGAASSSNSSPWQVTTRAMQVNQSMQSFNRKPRGDGR